MSKKSHPSDGQHGRGVKGEKRPFDDIFTPKKAEAEAEQDDAQLTDDRK